MRPTGHNRKLGAAGEEATAQWYLARGYTVMARNWRCREGEIDLVLQRGTLLVFCEVKTRTSDRFGTPAEAITPTKARRLRRLAVSYLADRRVRGEVRFDVSCVMGERIEVIEAAF